MDRSQLSLADIDRLLTVLEQKGGEAFIRGLINQVPVSPEMQYPRVTLQALQQLLAQTGGSVALPDHVVELLHQPERPIVTGVTWGQAQQCLRKNMILPAAVEKYFSVHYTPAEAEQLALIPFSLETLNAFKNTHLLFPGYQLSIIDLWFRRRDSEGDSVFGSFEDFGDFASFAIVERVDLRWYLLRKDGILDSYGQTASDQERLLDPREEIPRACELCYGLALWHAVTGSYLVDGDNMLRCQDLAEEDGCTSAVFIGEFDDDGLAICYGDGWQRADDEAYENNHGLASMVRLP